MIDYRPSCEDEREPGLIPVAQARARMAAELAVVEGLDTVPLAQSRGRVLASTIVSPIDVPPVDNSAMDGYALHSSDIPASGEVALTVVGRSMAGQAPAAALQAGQAQRIFTGAVMPPGADTVVMQEHVEVIDEQSVRIDSRVVAGKNVRPAGEDVARGEVVLEAGRILQPSDIGVLASLGIADVNVRRRLRVAVFSSGDELVPLESHPSNEGLPAGKLFDSNRFSLRSLLDDPAIELIDLGVVPDTTDATRAVLEKGAAQADLMVSSGGVSTGDADHVGRCFSELGTVGFWRLAMRPGRPLAFGHIDNTVFFGLPGNPVAVMVTFLQFVRPAIKTLLGCTETEPLTLPARADTPFRKSPGRTEYQRGILRVNEHGDVLVSSTGKQGAGRLSSISMANCLVVIDADVDGVAVGDRVQVQPFHGLM